MTALNFKARFADAVGRGEKRQTIRAQRADGRRFKLGERLQLFTGMRTQSCRRLGEGIVTAVLPVEIAFRREGLRFALGTVAQTDAQIKAIALADGFEDADAMLDFLIGEHGLPFRGWLIRWRGV